MRISTIQTAAPLRAALAGMLAMGLLAGCSSSVAPEEPEPSASSEPTQSAQPSESPSTSAEPSANASDENSDNPFKSYTMEGSPVEWTTMSLDGADHNALVPTETRAGGGSVVWKGTNDLTGVKFTAAIPADSGVQSPVMVKAITADSGRPVMVELQPGGSPETLEVPMNNSDVFKIVWNVEGKPSDGPNVVFYDFDTAK